MGDRSISTANPESGDISGSRNQGLGLENCSPLPLSWCLCLIMSARCSQGKCHPAGWRHGVLLGNFWKADMPRARFEIIDGVIHQMSSCAWRAMAFSSSVAADVVESVGWLIDLSKPSAVKGAYLRYIACFLRGSVVYLWHGRASAAVIGRESTPSRCASVIAADVILPPLARRRPGARARVVPSISLFHRIFARPLIFLGVDLKRRAIITQCHLSSCRWARAS